MGMGLSDWYWEKTQAVRKGADLERYKKYARQLKWLLGQGYAEPRIKKTVELMRQSGLILGSPLSIRYDSPDKELSWYDYAESLTPPPLWDAMAFEYWQEGKLPASRKR